MSLNSRLRHGVDEAEVRPTPFPPAYSPRMLETLRAALAGRYDVEREIARGGMAVVFLARDLKHRRPIAIKVLKPELGQMLGADRFMREIEIAAQLSHPNILPVHDSGEAGGLLYYVMPYLEGETLRGRLHREGPLPLDETIQIVQQVAGALGHAHSRGLIHRDIKPENILFQAGHAVVSDFGIARAISRAASPDVEHLTGSGMAIGTVAYMSPEQAAGKKDLDNRSDLYSLGCVLYEMLTGEVPLGPSTSGALTEGPAADLRRMRSSVSLPLASVIVKALGRLPADRFATAAQFSEALQRSTHESVPAATDRPPWRRWVLPVGIFTAVVLIAALSVDSVRARVLGRTGARTAITLAVLPFENLTADPAQEFFSDGLTEEMITQLGHLAPGRLGIIARTSAMRYKKTDKPIDQVGRELGVQYLLEGTVRREGGRVRIATELIRVRDQARVWGEAYERDLSGILAVQSAVAQGVAGSLALALLPGERIRLAAARPVDPEAYEAYLKGTEHANRLTRADLETALKYFDLALRKDSAYAMAYLGVGHAWSGLQQMGFVSPGEAQPHMRASVARALALDSSLGGAHYRLAAIKVWSDFDWPAGENEFRTAVALDPNDAAGRSAYAHFLQIMKRPGEAVTHMARAIELDPFNPQVRAFNAVMLGQLRRYDDAIGEVREVQRTVPNMPMALNQLPNLLYLKGDLNGALAAERSSWTLRNDREVLVALDSGAAEGGYRRAMGRVANRLAARARRGKSSPPSLAGYFIKAGELDQAMEWLERSYQAREPNMPYIGVAPIDDPLRSNPRFQELLRKLKLP